LEGGFIGKDAVLAQKAGGILHKRMLQVLVKDPEPFLHHDDVILILILILKVLVKDPEPFLHHGEVIYRDGVPVGDIRAGSYGHTLGGAVGLTMVDAGEKINKAYLQGGHWEVEIAGSRYPVEVSLQPLYDPKNLRIKM